ncbi:MotA/TolQ/ExbB proton channel family protein [Photobacterium nomapromontoriensis]
MRYVLLTLISAVMIWPATVVADMATYQRSLEAQVVKEQRLYQKEAQRIDKQRQPLLLKTTQAESQLLALRQQLLAFTRQNDDAYLSVQALEQRLQLWQQQDIYLNNIVSQYQQRQSQAAEEKPLAAIESDLYALGGKLYPRWHHGQAIAKDGAILQGQLLDFGPLNFFYQPSTLHLLTEQDHDRYIAVSYAQETQPTTALMIDISGDKAITIAANSASWLQRLQLGGVWIYPIIGMGFIAMAIAFVKACQIKRLTKLDPAFASHFVQDHTASLPQGWQGQLAQFSIAKKGIGWDALADLLHQQLLGYKHRLDKGMTFITATAAVAPLMGLLGTVSGMISTFDLMSLFGNQDASLLSGGISEALVTTELGLIVAIPALLSHAWLSRHHQGYLAQLDADAMIFSQFGEEGRNA